MNPEYIPRIIHMRNIPGYPDRRALDDVLSCLMYDGTYEDIPIDFDWDGSSTPTTPIAQFLVPRHAHPINSCEHDYRCGRAKNKEEREWNDNMYRKGIWNTPVNKDMGKFKYYRKRTWLGIQSVAGWIGVRIGAVLGIGNNF